MIGWGSFVIVDKSFIGEEFDELIVGLRFIISVEKKIAKGQDFERTDTHKRIDKIEKTIASKNSSFYKTVKELLADINVYSQANDGAENMKESRVHFFNSCEGRLDDLSKKVQFEEGLKYPAGVLGFGCALLLLVRFAVPGIAFMFFSLRDASVLENKLIVKKGNTDTDAFIPAGLTM